MRKQPYLLHFSQFVQSTSYEMQNMGTLEHLGPDPRKFPYKFNLLGEIRWHF